MRGVVRYLFLCGLAILIFASSLLAQGSAKKRVALFDFEYGAVHHWWGNWEWDIGKGISDMIVTNLVRDGTYSVIERKQLDKILTEQNFSNSERANPATAAKIGKVAGVNAIVIGTVTQFGFENKSLDTGALTSHIPGFGGAHVGTKSGKATVVLDARMVDTETGEVLAVASGKGSSKRSGMLLGGYGGGSGGGVDMGSSDFRSTIIGEATQQAVDDVTTQLVAQAGKINATVITINGKIADVDGNTLTLNVGKNQGLKVGDVVAIERFIKEIKDPDTGAVIRRETQPLGTAKITSVDDRSAVATYSGVGQPKVGDSVKSQ
jgi:curli biogenesis system outer membrane secretion channel CsgG